MAVTVGVKLTQAAELIFGCVERLMEFLFRVWAYSKDPDSGWLLIPAAFILPFFWMFNPPGPHQRRSAA